MKDSLYFVFATMSEFILTASLELQTLIAWNRVYGDNIHNRWIKNEFALWGERHFLISQISERCVLSHTYTHLEKENTYSYLCFINAHCFAFGKTTNHCIARFCLAGNFNHFHTLLDLFLCLFNRRPGGHTGP